MFLVSQSCILGRRQCKEMYVQSFWVAFSVGIIMEITVNARVCTKSGWKMPFLVGVKYLGRGRVHTMWLFYFFRSFNTVAWLQTNSTRLWINQRLKSAHNNEHPNWMPTYLLYEGETAVFVAHHMRGVSEMGCSFWVIGFWKTGWRNKPKVPTTHTITKIHRNMRSTTMATYFQSSITCEHTEVNSKLGSVDILGPNYFFFKSWNSNCAKRWNSVIEKSLCVV